MTITPVTLTGNVVRLEPLTMEHHAGLSEVGLDPELWRWSTAPVRTPDDLRKYMETAVLWREQGTAIPFTTIEKSSNRIVGSTRFANIDFPNKRGEIGWTWIARPWQRTAVNTEAKYLMLQHAFETLGFIRVEFKADSLNERSRTAILRIGAKEEGIFRNHMVCEDGRIRHSAYYSIVDSEWPGVKATLRQKLGLR